MSLLPLLTLLAIAAAPVPPPLHGWLTALDSAPTPAQLRQAGGPTLVQTLARVAQDPKAPQLERYRAAGFLALLDDKAADVALGKLLTHPDDGLRATAVLAWLSGPVRRHPELAQGRMGALLADKAPGVRDAAVRGLRYLPDRRAARALAATQRAREQDPAVQRQLDAAIRALDAPVGR